MNADQAATLEALAARVEVATGASRELDAEIALTLGLITRRKWSYLHKASGRECEVDETRDIETGHLIVVPGFTSDPAAPLREIERRFPGTAFSVGWCERETHAWALDDDEDGIDVLTPSKQDSVTAAMARALTALLLRLVLAARSAADGR